MTMILATHDPQIAARCDRLAAAGRPSGQRASPACAVPGAVAASAGKWFTIHGHEWRRIPSAHDVMHRAGRNCAAGDGKGETRRLKWL